MPDFTNDDRAEAARVGLQEFTDRMFHAEVDRNLSDPDVFFTACGDFLADLMHLCDRSGPEGAQRENVFNTCLGRALSHYREEVAEEEEPAFAPLRSV